MNIFKPESIMLPKRYISFSISEGILGLLGPNEPANHFAAGMIVEFFLSGQRRNPV